MHKRLIWMVLVALILYLPGSFLNISVVHGQTKEKIELDSLALFPNPDPPFQEKDHPGSVAKTPKNVVLMIGDGMGIGQLEIARLFEHGKNGRLFMETLPNVALAHTYSENNTVTDSAAAGTALATGKKTNNEMIARTPDNKPVESILKKVKKGGKKVGIITTNKVTDATPATFTASVKNRWSDQTEIAKQQLNDGLDVVLGGGKSDFEPEQQNGVNLIEKFKSNGYTFVNNRADLSKATGEKLLGLFNKDHLSFKLDREELKSEEPSLKEMTEKGLEFLSEGDSGFFLMVEGGRIDHASHAADLPSVWKETIEFDHTVEYVTNWAKERGDTLVVVLADHETMGISATEAMDIKALKQIEVSHEFMAKQLKKIERTGDYTADSIRDVFKTYANMDISDEEIVKFNEKIKNVRDKVYSHRRVGWEIGSMITEHYHGGIVSSATRSLSSTGGHTGNLVPVFAYGVGSDKFEGVLNNTDIPKTIADLMGYRMED
ncbi:alkaline phosphatase [Mesobacillus maritimus]|uniref:alkaline phosphatase n=1 Tax=Mesobacillus maritimus TaxID=1643336 RepID=UPI00203BB703|nr:alkaline phosphatase [Mesobacillus maritimus]MCM3585261.1 alkaline phosphatase [Mesobacillus maritimus]MCM3668148.1 alkaline phosphatase [Mesobacillus maritimus]